MLDAATLDALGRPPQRTPAAAARAFAERVQRTDLAPAGAAGLARRFRGGGRIPVTDVRWRGCTVHLSALDLNHPLQEA